MSGPVAVTLHEPANYGEWRNAARRLLAAKVPPDQVGFRLAATSGDLFDTAPQSSITRYPATCSASIAVKYAIVPQIAALSPRL